MLVNKLGITDLTALQEHEERGLVEAYERLLGEVKPATPLSCALLCYIHYAIFGELYDWAGRWRTVWIQKPGDTWPPAGFLDQSMRKYERKLLEKYPAAALTSDTSFCQAAGRIEGEFLVIHPFREGNARAIKLAVDLLAVQTGRPLLLYDESNEGRNAYSEAAKAAFNHRYQPLTRIVNEALDRARQARPGA